MKKLLTILACIALLVGGFAALAEYEDTLYLDSLEEAAELYGGEIPELTPPEGFELVQVMLDDFGLTISYESDAAAFDMTLYEYGEIEGITHYNLSGGTLSEAGVSMVDVYEEEGLVTNADVYSSKGAIYFSFTDMDMAQVEAVLAGLAL